jgi:hypothetical protein
MDATNKNSELFSSAGNWENKAKELQQKFLQLTDADLKFEAGKENELLNRIGSRLKKKREDVIALIQGKAPEKSLVL